MTSTNNNTISMCANCGKGEDDTEKLKACTACKLVKYCNRECQIAHRPQHKKECKKRAKELHDEALFKQPPKSEDCPICMLRLPSLVTGRKYKYCCGKVICSGCIYAVKKIDGDMKCPFCRVPAPTKEELHNMLRKRIEIGDAEAMYHLGSYYANGYGVPHDDAKALELWHKAGELGCSLANHNLGWTYDNGIHNVQMDKKKAKHYREQAAIGGDVKSRNNLGAVEEVSLGNKDRALKHYMIAARDGSKKSLENIKALYSNGHATKDDYATALRNYQAYLDEIRSDQRDEAAAYDVEDYGYYDL